MKWKFFPLFFIKNGKKTFFFCNSCCHSWVKMYYTRESFGVAMLRKSGGRAQIGASNITCSHWIIAFKKHIIWTRRGDLLSLDKCSYQHLHMEVQIPQRNWLCRVGESKSVKRQKKKKHKNDFDYLHKKGRVLLLTHDVYNKTSQTDINLFSSKRSAFYSQV